ncbi:cobalamin B12-binding domain-containing protein [Prescottella agglutinans]|uniref:cobalamin B12-binding domain-containing protein n=1 Tax=Prescottella agglutinans TaxID=1644129 RepID=UPI003D95DD92
MGAPIRIMVTKIGLDGHDRGSRIIAAYLRDAGHEVIYTPPWQTIDAVVRLARQEDVAVIGVSSLATDHLIIPDLLGELRKEGLGHIAVVVGGIIPDSEHTMLRDAGIAGIFGPGSSRDEIVDAVTKLGEAVVAAQFGAEVSA